MKLTLSRRQHHSTLDFERERADLEQGRQNLIAAYRGYIDQTMADEDLSYNEKQMRLEVYKAGLEQAEEDYQAEILRLKAEEIQQLADIYGVPLKDTGLAAEAETCRPFGGSRDVAEQLESEGPRLENDGFSY